MFWDSKVCCFIWKREVGYPSLLVAQWMSWNTILWFLWWPVLVFFSWCFFWNVFYFRPNVGLPKMQERIQSHQFADISSLHLWCPAGLFPTWHLPNFIKSPQNWFALPVNTFPKWVIPCRNGLVTTQPLQHPPAITGRRARLRLVRVCQTGTWSRTRTSFAWWFHGNFSAEFCNFDEDLTMI